ncbi:MAG: hypothetical protein H8E31_07755 [Planctomycetes bacterium]|nr:hypothetical protein [Planctomycetota bacterium]
MIAAYMILALLPQQDFAEAQNTYGQVEATPTEVVLAYETRADAASQRVTVLEERLVAESRKLEELDRLEVERYLALKGHFEGEELERRLAREMRDFELRRRGVESSIALTQIDLEDARARTEQLEIDLRLARIERGLSEGPPQDAGTPVTDRLAERARLVLWERGLELGSFTMRPTPLAWVTSSETE